jgi:hypothetical protein
MSWPNWWSRLTFMLQRGHQDALERAMLTIPSSIGYRMTSVTFP